MEYISSTVPHKARMSSTMLAHKGERSLVTRFTANHRESPPRRMSTKAAWASDTRSKFLARSRLGKLLFRCIQVDTPNVEVDVVGGT